MSSRWKVTKPKNDAEYFERMTQTVFNAGLNWALVKKKWPNFHKSFAGFFPTKVAGFSEKNVKALMSDEGIVRNERKIRATIRNAGHFLKLQKEFGSFADYLESFDSRMKNDSRRICRSDSSTLVHQPREPSFGRLVTSLRRTLKRRNGWQVTTEKSKRTCAGTLGPCLTSILLRPTRRFAAPHSSS